MLNFAITQLDSKSWDADWYSAPMLLGVGRPGDKAIEAFLVLFLGIE